MNPASVKGSWRSFYVDKTPYTADPVALVYSVTGIKQMNMTIGLW